jgi:uncharacterized membrane protein (UPF0127 family)
MKGKFAVICLVLVVLSFFYIRFLGNRPKYTLLSIGETSVKVEVADTIGKQRQGLSGRAPLGSDHGMLFVMATPDRHAFVMRDMKFPLDIVWIRDNKVVDISLDVPHPVNNEKPATVQPSEPANLVLEVNAGWTRMHQIKIGDTVRESK